MSDSLITKLSPEQAGRAIRLCWMADNLARQTGMPFRVPVCLVGSFGCGKTETVKQFYREIAARDPQFKYWGVNLSMMDAAEIGGIPEKLGDNHFHYLSPSSLPFDDPDARGIIFADEVDRASSEVLNAFQPLVLGGEVHDHKLAPNVYVISAMNGSTDIYTTPLSSAMRTRYCFVYVSQSGDLASYLDWSTDVGLPDTVREFRKNSEDLMIEAPIEDLAICVSRTVDMAGLIQLASHMVKFKVDDIILACLAGCIGRVAAVKLMNCDRLKGKIPTLEDIIANPLTAIIPAEFGYLAVVKSSYILRIRDQKMCERVETYIARLPDELQICWAKELIKRKLEFASESIKAIACREI